MVVEQGYRRRACGGAGALLLHVSCLELQLLFCRCMVSGLVDLCAEGGLLSAWKGYTRHLISTEL